MRLLCNSYRLALGFALCAALAAGVLAQVPDEPPPRDGGFQPTGEADFDGPPPFGPGGFGPGGPGGMMQETKLVAQFDKNGDGWLNAVERKAAREFLNQEGGARRGPGGRGGRRGGFGRPGESQESPKPGAKLAPGDVKSFPDAPLYASNVLRTLFLQFENADWEKELADFKNTDVEVPAKLTVDGVTYPDVGVHFHGASSFMMVGEGQKRSLVLTLDFIHPDQQLGGYRKLNLLNSHEDASFLRTVLALQIARDYLPAPKANFVRVAINGESWGVYVNQQHFNKDFVRDNFNTTKGARWKVPGSPNGRAGLNYLGEEASAYRRLYEIKTKDDAKAWRDLARLCKVLTQTPAAELEQALPPLLDVESALKFLAWENVLANGDGFWTRASDYSLYEDPSGRFHVLPYDANETFSSGGGPGRPGAGPGGMGGRGGFGPGMALVPAMMDQGDKNADGKLSKEELSALAELWFDKLDPGKSGHLTQEEFTANLSGILPMPQAFGPAGGGAGPGGQRGSQFSPQGRGGRSFGGPAMFLGPVLYQALDADKDGSLTRSEMQGTYAKWFEAWDVDKTGRLTEENLRTGLNNVLPRPSFGGPAGMAGPGAMGGGGRGRGGFGGGPGGGRGGVELDPLVGVNDNSKPLLSKLLAVPAWRTRYLGHVREMAEKWLDWKRLGSLAQGYHDLIAADVQADARKLDSTEDFLSSLTGGVSTERGFRAPPSTSLKDFADKRRTFLLNYKETKPSAN